MKSFTDMAIYDRQPAKIGVRLQRIDVERP